MKTQKIKTLTEMMMSSVFSHKFWLFSEIMAYIDPVFSEISTFLKNFPFFLIKIQNIH